MSEHVTSTTHGDAPLASARSPDARASNLWATEEDDELTARTITVDRPIAEVYAFVREPAALASLWDSEDATSLVVQEEPGNLITWHSTDRVAAQFSGRVELRVAPAGRGTEVTVTIATPSRNALHKLWDKINADDPRIRTRRALRRFKQLMETGEIATAAPGPAAPRA
jgi:uncharacterized membrane protein